MTLASLSLRQQGFVSAYLAGETMGNAAASAIKAGYSALTADDLLANPSIRAAIADAQEAAAAETKITKARAMAELGRIAFSDITRVVSWGMFVVQTGERDDDGQPVTREMAKVILKNSDEIHPSATAAIAEISEGQFGVKIKLCDKVSALVELGRHLGIAQKIALTGPDGKGPVETITRDMTLVEAADLYRRVLEEGKMPQ